MNTPMYKTGKLCIALLLFQICFLSCHKSQITDVPFSKDKNNHTALSFQTSDALAKPNIILILGDDIGYEIPTVDGGQSYSTPTLDMMAQNGARFTQCHASPLCSPSRVSLVTGKYNFRNYFTWGSLPLSEKTIANMLLDAGYKTCVSGKWQFDGGATSISNFGFEKYCVWDAFKYSNGESGNSVGSAYKNPKIYQNGEFLPASQVQNKYGEDIFCQYVKDFIDSNRSHPFFVYYPMVLCHDPFSPTPDDAAFASWNPKINKSDTAWFPSMVKYMDKKIGEVITKLTDDNLLNKTVILYIGDNGTSEDIYSQYNGRRVRGAKSQTNEWGTHVPLIVYGASKIKKGIVNDLVCFPDFLPTLADIAGIPEPTGYGTLDGTSFYNPLAGKLSLAKGWIYTYYNAYPDSHPTNTAVWSQNANFKLYNDSKTGFYNMKNDLYEQKPISNDEITPAEQQSKDSLQADINSIQ